MRQEGKHGVFKSFVLSHRIRVQCASANMINHLLIRSSSVTNEEMRGMKKVEGRNEKSEG